MKTIHLVGIVALSTFASVSALAAAEPLFNGLGTYKHKVTTDSPQAQRYFNQGLAFYHGFNHGEAIRSFQEAARLDPKCAMAHWGIALACGPHINLTIVAPPAAELAFKELKLAQENAGHASAVERDLVEALSHRYANPQPEDRAPLDQAYGDAMRKVWQAHPDDPEVGVLFAEAMMDLQPWNQWTPDGQPNTGTEEILVTLDAVLKLNPNHPFANHLYIHALEASPHPERADAAAEHLRTLQPGLAHNVHMPSHIDIRRGRWQQAIATNLNAVKADRRYRQIVGIPKGLVPLYAAHNRHMLAYAAMMTGQRKLAVEQIRAMVAEFPPDFVKENAMSAEGFAAMPLEVLVRFGRWDEILAAPDNYPDYMPFTRAFHHAARAVACAAKGDAANARQAQAIYLERAKLVPTDDFIWGNNSCQAILGVVTPMVEGEILVAEGKIDDGVAQLRAGVAVEDALKYDEPPGWLIPIRHSLGAVLTRNGRFAEAEQIYRDDLKRQPDNGWSLFGLTESLREQGKNKEEREAMQLRFRKIWAKSDLKLTSSCLCQAAKTSAKN